MPSDQLPSDIAERLWDLSHRFKAGLRAGLAEGAPDLHPFQAKALSAIGRHPGLLPNQLAEHSGRDKAQVARVLKDLEDRGLIERSPHPTDRRTHCLTLTPSGTTVFARLQENRHRTATRMMEGISPQDRQHLSDLLEAMARNLTDPT